MWMTVQMKWWWFRLHYRVCSSEDCSCRCEEVSFVCVCVFQLVPQWSPPCLCCLPLLCRSLENQPHCSACSALTLQRGRRWAGRWTGQRSPRGVQTSTESERDGRYSRSSVLSLSKARWEGVERFVCRVTHDGAAQETSFLKSSGCWCFSSEEQQDSQQSRDLQLNTQAVFQSAAIAVHSIKLLNALHLCSTASLISVSFLH